MPSPLGEKIHARRTELKLSLEKLAALTDSSKSYLWELENRDKANPSAEKIAQLAKHLKVTPDYLLVATATASVDDEIVDKAYFRKFQQMSEDNKMRIRQLIDAWDNDK